MGTRKRRVNPWVLFAIGVVLIIGVGVAAYLVLAEEDATAEVILQATADNGPDPFTDSVADMRVNELTSNGESIAGEPVGGIEGGDGSVESVEGSAPGLYGGSEQEQVCDPQAMVDFLEANPDKAAAWASAQGIAVDDLADFVATLTPVILREDTRVTNNGFVDGAASPFQAVLQAGTAVLVDDRGVPRVRCACGNPLGEPEATPDTPEYSGESWSRFDSNRIVAVSASPEPVKSFDLIDVETGERFEQPAGGGGGLTVDELINLNIPTVTCEEPDVPWVDGVHPSTGEPSGLGQVAIAVPGAVGGPFTDDDGLPELQADIGDLTGDGTVDGAVATLETCDGANANFPHLFAYDSDGELLGGDLLDGSPIGTPQSLEIVDGGIEVDSLTLGPTDPRTQPSVETHTRFEWNGESFEQVDGGGSDVPSPDATDDAVGGSPIPDDAVACKPLVYADPVATSCSFAEAIAAAVGDDPGAGSYEVTSPDTGGTYTVTCGDAEGNAAPDEQGAHVTVCTAGEGAVVYLA